MASDIVICEKCHNKEQEEIEQDEFWEMINDELGETLYHLKDKEGAWEKLSNENRALIIQLSNNEKSKEVCDKSCLYFEIKKKSKSFDVKPFDEQTGC